MYCFDLYIMHMQPSLSPCRLCLFNTTTGAAIRELNFLTSILDVCMNRQRSNLHLHYCTFPFLLFSLVSALVYQCFLIKMLNNIKLYCIFNIGIWGGLQLLIKCTWSLVEVDFLTHWLFMNIISVALPNAYFCWFFFNYVRCCYYYTD